MDLKADQHRHLSKFIDDWSKDKSLELETTFGERGVVDSNTFLQIAQRIRSKNFEVLPQDDRLNVMTPNNIRLSLQGLGIIQQYCRDNHLQNKAFTVMRKERNSPDSNLDLTEYDVRIKMRRETELASSDESVAALLENWAQERKAFRLIRRWSFKGKGIRIDMSMVRQTPTNPSTGQFHWSTTFLQRNILEEPARYEVEVELLHDTEDTNTAESAMKSLIRGVGEVERAIQRNTLLIRKSVAAAVRAEYQRMVGTSEFRGVNPVTLQLENMTENPGEDTTNIRTGYNVTDKADGLRAMGFVNATGELFLIDQSMNVYRTGLRNPACALSLLDGEWVTMTMEKKPINHYLIFDIYHYEEGKVVSTLPFIAVQGNQLDPAAASRYNCMKAWYDKWTSRVEVLVKGVTDSTRLVMALKRFEFASAGNDSVFKKACSAILDGSRLYHTDGLILTRNAQALPDGAGIRFSHQYKWKPAIDNTVDFLITYERDSDTKQELVSTSLVSEEVIQYKTMRLYVGGKTMGHPRDLILNQLPLTKQGPSPYKAVLFTPMDYPDTMANLCYIKMEQDSETMETYCSTEDSKEPIPDCSIVEMRYDPTREPGWRWVPSRIRHDKTERLLKEKEKAKKSGRSISYSRTMNDEKVAQSVWNSIHEPITLSMIRTGRMEPSVEEMRALMETRKGEMSTTYYQRNAPKENTALVRGLRDFHNEYIKDGILIRSGLSAGKHLVDVACGKGGDLWKWIKYGAQYVMGIDYAGENITNPKDGAYARYADVIPKSRGKVPNVAFAIGNSAKRIVTGEAGGNPQEQDILRSVFGKENPQAPVPKYIEQVMAGQFRGGADVVSCMFALHYFFENATMLDGFLGNLSDIVKPNGLFIGCCFDGDRVFQLLQNLEKGESKDGAEDGVTVWTMTKEYEDEEFLPDDSSIGMPVDVEFISIGSKHREYLVSFEYLKERMRKTGFRLLTEKEWQELGLTASTATFDTTYQDAVRKRKSYPMPDSVRDFSFLNRWFIFKRQVAADVEVPPIELDEEKSMDAEEKEAERPAAEAAAEAAEPAEVSSFRLPLVGKKFKSSEIFTIGLAALQRNDLKMKDPKAGRWLSLSAPFAIPDPLPKELGGQEDEPTVWYPSIEHYLAGMKLKHAIRLPNASEYSTLHTIMSREGTIHQKELAKRTSDEDYASWTRESTAIRSYMRNPINVEKAKGRIDDTLWNPIRGQVLRNAIRYRFLQDGRFQKIVLAARNDNQAPKYLLHVNHVKNGNNGGASELYGVRNPSTEMIEGENEVGKAIMEVGGFIF